MTDDTSWHIVTKAGRRIEKYLEETKIINRS